jgi:hypothetical protein
MHLRCSSLQACSTSLFHLLLICWCILSCSDLCPACRCTMQQAQPWGWRQQWLLK